MKVLDHSIAGTHNQLAGAMLEAKQAARRALERRDAPRAKKCLYLAQMYSHDLKTKFYTK